MLTREAFRPPPPRPQIFCTLALWTTATRESPRHGDLSHKKTIAATLPTQYDYCILFKPRIQNPRT